MKGRATAANQFYNDSTIQLQHSRQTEYLQSAVVHYPLTRWQESPQWVSFMIHDSRAASPRFAFCPGWNESIQITTITSPLFLHLFAIICSSSWIRFIQPQKVDQETQKLRTFFIAIFGFSLFFWIWAVKNTVGMDNNNFDLGVFSFATVLVTSSYMMGMIASSSFVSAGKFEKYATTSSHMFVAINYFLGSFIGFAVMGRPGFGFYCVVFTGLWLGVAYYGHILMKSASTGGSLSENIPLSV